MKVLYCKFEGTYFKIARKMFKRNYTKDLLTNNPQKYAALNQNCRDSQKRPVALYSHSGLRTTAFPTTHKIQSSYRGFWQIFY